MTTDITINDDTMELDLIKTFSNEHQAVAYKHYTTKKIMLSLIKNTSKVVGAISAVFGGIAALLEILI